MNTINRLFAVRGAVCCLNTKQSICTWTSTLYQDLLKTNSIDEQKIVSIQFTVTKDIDAINPATALRLSGLAINVPLFVASEPCIKGSLSYVIRILITFYGEKKPTSVYLNGAEVLRPDLIK